MPSKIPRPNRSALPKHRGHPAPRPTVDELLASQSRFKKVSTDFLKIELEMALTFTELAMQTRDHDKRERNRQAARKAYETVVHMMGRVPLSDDEANIFKKNLERLRFDLVDLGESV
jgi:hypothetical protein